MIITKRQLLKIIRENLFLEQDQESEWKKYKDEKDWEYKLEGQSPDQIWTTRKIGGNGKVFKLNQAKYKSTVFKLDAEFKTRTEDSIKKDPAGEVSAINRQPAQTASNEEKMEGWKKRKMYFDSFKEAYERLDKDYLDLDRKIWNKTGSTAFQYIKPMGRDEVQFKITTTTPAELSFVMKFSNVIGNVDETNVLFKQISEQAPRNAGGQGKLQTGNNYKIIDLKNIDKAINPKDITGFISGKELHLIALQALGRMKKYFVDGQGGEIKVKESYTEVEESPSPEGGGGGSANQGISSGQQRQADVQA